MMDGENGGGIASRVGGCAGVAGDAMMGLANGGIIQSGDDRHGSSIFGSDNRGFRGGNGGNGGNHSRDSRSGDSHLLAGSDTNGGNAIRGDGGDAIIGEMVKW